MNQQPQRANNATMSTAPSCESSPCLPSDWSTFRVSLLKFQFTDRQGWVQQSSPWSSYCTSFWNNGFTAPNFEERVSVTTMLLVGVSITMDALVAQEDSEGQLGPIEHLEPSTALGTLLCPWDPPLSEAWTWCQGQVPTRAMQVAAVAMEVSPPQTPTPATNRELWRSWNTTSCATPHASGFASRATRVLGLRSLKHSSNFHSGVVLHLRLIWGLRENCSYAPWNGNLMGNMLITHWNWSNYPNV